MENKSFSDLARSIAKEKFPLSEKPKDKGDEDFVFNWNRAQMDKRELWEACINEQVKEFYETSKEVLAMQEDEKHFHRTPVEMLVMINAKIRQAISNFEGGGKGDINPETGKPYFDGLKNWKHNKQL